MYVLRLLGGASLGGEAGRLTGPPIQRHRIALLALLSTAPAASMSRDKLVALLWPDSGRERARHSLNVAVHALRKALGLDAIRSVGMDLQLDHASVPSDIARFTAALASGDALTAVESYGGPFLDGFFLDHCVAFEQWQEAERARFAAQYSQALETLATAAEESNDRQGAVRWWRRLGANDPGNSRVAGRTMIALEHAGDRAGALAVAAAHRALMLSEYGAEPNPALVALAARIRNEPAGERLALPDMDGVARDTPSAVVESPPPPPPVPSSATIPTAVPASASRWSWVVGAAALVAVAIGGAMVARRRAVEARVTTLPAEVSIAVLPFQNLSADARDQYLSDGVTEELLNALTRVRGLRVAARTSSFFFRDREADAKTIGRRLDVSTLVEGSLRASGNRLRVTVQLVDARTGDHVWSEEFDRAVSDLFAVQEDIARSVTAALHVGRAAPAGATLMAAGTASAKAHDLYLRGRFEWNKRTEAGMLAARDAFSRALLIDPRYARAYAGLSDTWQLLPLYGHYETREALANAKTAALRALALDSMLAEAHTSLAVTLLEYDHDRTSAEREYRRAIELNPGYATARHWYALFLIAGGRVAEATAEVEQARRTDPLSRIINAAAGTVRLFARDYPAAAAEFRAIVDQEPDWPTGLELLGRTKAAAGEYDVAVPILERAVTLSNRQPSQVALLAYTYARAGRANDARGLLRELRQAPAGSYAPPVDLAAVYVALGESGEALRILSRGLDERDEEMMYMEVDPRYDPLRSNPGFASILSGLDLR